MVEQGNYRMMLVLAYALICLTGVHGCGSIGGGTDGQLFQNPTLTWTMSPPTAWTFPVTYAQITQQYFPGQPLTQADATNQANGDLTAAALEALTNNNIPTTNIKIVTNYQPQMISDCVKIAGTTTGIPTQSMPGDIIGIVEAEAIVQLATVTTAISTTDCIARKLTTVTLQPYMVSASVTLNGVTLLGSQLKQVAAQFQSQLNFNNHVRFINPVTYA